jgi:thymidylate synthase ThyX
MIHSEFMTHRVFSRNASSSRAIPVAKVIEQVRNDPFIPSNVYMNQSGMVGTVEASEDTYESFKGLWLKAVDNAVAVAESMVALGVHKQHVNRILEPFQYINVIVTATEWENFLHLRLASDAQPEMQDLARAIKGEMDKVGNNIISVYHICGKYVSLPFITQEEVDEHCMNSFSSSEVLINDLMLISSARCARVSYNNHDGSCPDERKDKKLARRLLDAGHMSPMEHPCIWAGDMRYHRNLYGWESLRCKFGY